MISKNGTFNYSIHSIFFLLVISQLTISCVLDRTKQEEHLYAIRCGSCHLPPDPASLPKHIWKENILPDMGARLGIRQDGYDPHKGLGYAELAEIVRQNIYPKQPLISEEEWDVLTHYIMNLAPDSLDHSEYENREVAPLSFFRPHLKSLKDGPGAIVTQIDVLNDTLYIGTGQGEVFIWDGEKKERKFRVDSPVLDVDRVSEGYVAISVGKLDPTEQRFGQVVHIQDQQQQIIANQLHRPVNQLIVDLNNDSMNEIVVSEFGNYSGMLSLFVQNGNGGYQKQTLINAAGAINTFAEDMNNDGKLDLIAIVTQGDESVYVLYQQDSLKFDLKKVIQLAPTHGSSWFDLIDYNHDGLKDIVIANGDNADNSYVYKPYHGIRLFINQGNDEFEQKYFFPMHGATKVIARDFDQDNDIDFAVSSFFPDYKNYRKESFLFLENTNEKKFEFIVQNFQESDAGRWMVMTSGDIDHDGDEDIILGSTTQPFGFVPEALENEWMDNKVDFIILENTIK